MLWPVAALMQADVDAALELATGRHREVAARIFPICCVPSLQRLVGVCLPLREMPVGMKC